MPITFTQDEWKVRSLDVVHINPSILEGQFAHDSLYGKRSAELLIRYAPVNLVPPSISGDFKIPSTLVCNPGVWDAAPTADYLYQWRADGVEIPGETGPTWTSDISFDAMEIDCVVTAVNVIGFDTLPSSNQITVEIVEPIEVTEQDYYTITGLDQFAHQNMNIFRMGVVTGIAVPDQLTSFEQIMGVVSGMEVVDTLTNFDAPAYVVSGIAAETRMDTRSIDSYVLQMNEFIANGAILNHNAEDGMNNWNQTNASHNVVSSGQTTPFQGASVFWGGANPSCGMEQEIAVPVAAETDIDNGLCMTVLGFMLRSFNGNDRVRPTLEFKNSLGEIIGVRAGGTYIGESSYWNRRTLGSTSNPIPTGTRFVNIKFDFIRYNGTNLDAYVDEIVLEFWKQIGVGNPTSPLTFTDPHFANVSILMDMEGVVGTTPLNNQALYGRNPYITSGAPEFSASGALSAASTTGAAFNVSANNNDKLGIDRPGACGCDFGTGDFTIEGFAESTADSNTYWHSILGNFVNSDPGSFAVMRRDNNDGGVLIFLCDDNPSVQGTSDVAVGFGSFHFAISRNGDTLRLFVNGVMEGKITGFAAVNVGGTQPVRIGGNNAGSNDNWRGYIDNIRVTKGVGRYDNDASFTVPTTLYAL